MKKLALALITLASVQALAATSDGGGSSTGPANPVTETIEFGVDLEVSKCVTSTNQQLCDAVGSLPSNISVELKNCSSVPQGWFCYGTWNGTTSRDGYSFLGSITVTKSTYVDQSGNESSSYMLQASVGSAMNSYQPTSISILLSNEGTVTDSVSFNGVQFFAQNSGDSYVPSLLIAPKMPEQWTCPSDR